MQHSRGERIVGRVVGLWRYPVKSMGAEELTTVDVGWNGVAGDRRWAFVRSDATHSGFPWLTLRERPDMRRFVPSYVEPARPDASRVQVQTPSGDAYDVADPALASELYDGARAIKQDRGIFDTFPLSILTVQSVRSLGELVGEPLDVQRFRPNILVEAVDEGFPEDEWVGGSVGIGGSTLRIDKRDGRCAIITIDPATAEKDPAILRAVATERQGCLGVYATTMTPGPVALGDPVSIR